jgi:hypothetical protein
MNFRKTLTSVLLLVVFIHISGCSASDPKVEAVLVEELVVTFESDSCIYGGPEVIQQGEFTVIFDNQTDKNMIYDLFLIPEGKSWQDLVKNFAGGTRNVSRPDWAILQSGKRDIKETNKKVYNLDPGLYALLCAEITQTGGWENYLGSPFEVK